MRTNSDYKKLLPSHSDLLLLPNQYELLVQRIEFLNNQKGFDDAADLLPRMVSLCTKFRNASYARKILMDGSVDKDFQQLGQDLYPILEKFKKVGSREEDKEAAAKDFKAFYSAELTKGYPSIYDLDNAIASSIQKRLDEMQEAYQSNRAPPQVEKYALFTFKEFRRLAAGGYGTAYAVTNDEETICLKVFEQNSANNLPMVRELEREADFMKKLVGAPGVVQYLFHNTSPEAQYIGMEYIEGGTLGAHIAERLLFSERLARALEVAVAVDHLHRRGIIHCDIKLANVLMRRSGECVLTDFGLSIWTSELTTRGKTDPVGGTTWYMAPEIIQMQDDDPVEVTPKADVYAFGILLWEIISQETIAKAQIPAAVVSFTVLRGDRKKLPTVILPYEKVLPIIEKCWAQKYSERPEMPEVCLQLTRQIIGPIAEHEEAIGGVSDSSHIPTSNSVGPGLKSAHTTSAEHHTR